MCLNPMENFEGANSRMNIIEVNKENVAEKGFFCYMSKRKSEGHQRKLQWLTDRFDEGMKIKMLDLKQGDRGFIEYTPGEYAWRAVNAEGYMFIHCIWVAGKSKGKGYGTLLLNECVRDARKLRARGVAVVTSEGNWLVGKEFFLKHGFEPVDKHHPFELLVKRFDDAAPPSFAGSFEEKARAFGKGLTIIRSDQCPYVHSAVGQTSETTNRLEIETRVGDLRPAEEVRSLSPSPYGVFGIVYDGKLVSYYCLSPEKLTTFWRNLGMARKARWLRCCF